MDEELSKKIEDLSKQIEGYHKEDIKRIKEDGYNNLSLISLGFGLTIMSIAVSIVIANNVHIDYILALIFFLILVAIFFLGTCVWARMKAQDTKRLGITKIL